MKHIFISLAEVIIKVNKKIKNISVIQKTIIKNPFYNYYNSFILF